MKTVKRLAIALVALAGVAAVPADGRAECIVVPSTVLQWLENHPLVL